LGLPADLEFFLVPISREPGLTPDSITFIPSYYLFSVYLTIT